MKKTTTKTTSNKKHASSPPPPTPVQVTKSEFIRAQDHATSAADVVAAGKAAGLDFNVGYVYSVRAAQTKRVRGPAAPAAARPEVSADGESFAKLALSLGVERAQKVLDALKAAVSS